MALKKVAEITYRNASQTTKVRYQADPPVCNRCQREITRQNFGWAYLESDGRTGEQFEWIECTACTAIRESGEPLLTFLQRHNL